MELDHADIAADVERFVRVSIKYADPFGLEKLTIRRAGVCWDYALGATDAACRSCGFEGDSDVLTVFSLVCVQLFNIPPKDVDTVVRHCAEAAADPHRCEIVRRGGQTYLDCASKKSPPFALGELWEEETRRRNEKGVFRWIARLFK